MEIIFHKLKLTVPDFRKNAHSLNTTLVCCSDPTYVTNHGPIILIFLQDLNYIKIDGIFGEISAIVLRLVQGNLEIPCN